MFFLGTIIGPAALGAFADRYGLDAAFVLTALIAVSTLLARQSSRRAYDTGRAPTETQAVEEVVVARR